MHLPLFPIELITALFILYQLLYFPTHSHPKLPIPWALPTPSNRHHHHHRPSTTTASPTSAPQSHPDPKPKLTQFQQRFDRFGLNEEETFDLIHKYLPNQKAIANKTDNINATNVEIKMDQTNQDARLENASFAAKANITHIQQRFDRFGLNEDDTFDIINKYLPAEIVKANAQKLDSLPVTNASSTEQIKKMDHVNQDQDSTLKNLSLHVDAYASTTTDAPIEIVEEEEEDVLNYVSDDNFGSSVVILVCIIMSLSLMCAVIRWNKMNNVYRSEPNSIEESVDCMIDMEEMSVEMSESQTLPVLMLIPQWSPIASEKHFYFVQNHEDPDGKYESATLTCKSV